MGAMATTPDRDVRLSDGVTQVDRVGRTVRRAQGPWSSCVHRLLDHLSARGFHGAPRFLGVDEQDREILDFVEGQTAPYPMPVGPQADRIMTSAAVLLRDYHDATENTELLTMTGWQLPATLPAEVVCHNDVAPYNCVVRDGIAVALIDFDTAAPGPRAWDLAYAVYRFASLCEGADDPASQGARVRLFLDAYGTDPSDEDEVFQLIPERLAMLVQFMELQADAGNPIYARHLAEGHADGYRRDIAYAAANAAVWKQAARRRRH